MSRRFMVQDETKRRRHRTLIGVILATLPCYFCGIVVLVGFSSGGAGNLRFGDTQTALALSASPTTTLTPTPGDSPTPTATYTPGGPTVTLPPTPTQFIPATKT